MSYINKQKTLDAIAQKAKDELADVNHYFLEGVQLAVDVVEGMPEPKEAENGSMPCPDARNSHDRTTDDCISRQTAIDATWFEPSYTDPLNVLTEVRDRLKVLPSARPKIIHCKDCKWSDWYDAADGHRYCYCMETGASGRTADDFCSYAEREEA